MKKLLIGTAAIALGVVAFSGPAAAQVSLDIEGHMKGYMSWVDQDTTNDSPFAEAVGIAIIDDTSEDERSVDILRETEVHFTGETTLDNGLTVGIHIETDIDRADNFNTEEGYAYFSGAWGRVNFGLEDGAGYLLQVAAPSADSNIDGIRQYVQPVNYSIMGFYDTGAAANIHDLSVKSLYRGIDPNTGVAFVADANFHDVDGSETVTAGDIRLGDAGAAAFGAGMPELFRFDYDMAVSGYSNKLTYLTPVFNGFQLGASYTPEIDQISRDFLRGNNDDDSYREYGNVWELAARYEGQMDEVGVTLGAGYTHASLESSNDETGGGVNDDDNVILYNDVDGSGTFTAAADTAIATLDDRQAWNVGLDLDWGPFGLGVSYSEDDLGVSGNMDRDVWVVGLDYTTGPFKLGATYYNTDQELGTLEMETDRYTGGVVYTYGPGMTFRGSLSYIDHEGLAADVSDSNATSLMLGTQINF